MRAYEAAYLADSGFEREMIRARRRLALEVLHRLSPASVLEIGCGTDPLYAEAAQLEAPPLRWTVVEPGGAFARIAEDLRSERVELEVVQALFEDAAPHLDAAMRPDFVACLGVLQSVADPVRWLGLVRDAMARSGALLVTVANAYSLHRRLARVMGLIADERELSPRDRAGFHTTVFDLERLSATVAEAGFQVERAGGYLLKPFAHDQMDRIRPILTDEMLDGLWQLGSSLPELASEIYVVGRPA